MARCISVTVRDRCEVLHGSAEQTAEGFRLHLASCGYPGKKLQLSMLKDYHKF